jgi:single-strand DNA-binding protein
MGRLAQDVVLKQGPNQPYVDFAIAINTGSNDKKDVDFINCRAFARNAENICQYFYKGRPIFLTGKIRQNKWTDSDGKNCSSLRVSVKSFEFIDSNAKKETTTSKEPIGSVVSGVQFSNDESDFDSI